MENGCIESFNGRLWDERLNVELFFDLLDARKKFVLGGATTTKSARTPRPVKLTPVAFASRCEDDKGLIEVQSSA